MGKELPFAGGLWRPKYPEAAVGRRGPLAREDPEASQLADWVMAPGTSHVMKFRFQDARRVRAEGFHNSILTVWFKATRTKPAVGYNYYFSDHDRGMSIFREMSGHAHPGEVVHASLIKPGVRYEPVAMGDEDLQGIVHLRPEDEVEVMDLSGFEDDFDDRRR